MAPRGHTGPPRDCTPAPESAASSIGTNRACAERVRGRPLRPYGTRPCAAYTRGVSEVQASARSVPPGMDDERWELGMPVLDRQAAHDALPRAAGGHGPTRPPRSVPETRPTPLPRDWFVYLSVVAFLAGAVAITALEFGATPSSPVVEACVLVGSPPLAVALADAAVRIWRSAWAWMPVDRAKGLFRIAWLAVPAVGFAGIAVALVAVLGA